MVKRVKQESPDTQTNTQTTYYLPCFAVDKYPMWSIMFALVVSTYGFKTFLLLEPRTALAMLPIWKDFSYRKGPKRRVL